MCNVTRTRNVDDKASKTAVVLPLEKETTKIVRNKAPILAQHDNSRAMFRKMSNNTNHKEKAQYHMPHSQPKRTIVADPKEALAHCATLSTV